MRIVDRNAGATDKSKALVIWPRTLELLDIQGCAQAFLAAGMKAVGARMLADGKTLVHVRFDTARSVLPLRADDPAERDRALLEANAAQLGVRVERRVELTSFAQDDDGVTAVLRHADGRDEHGARR